MEFQTSTKIPELYWTETQDQEYLQTMILYFKILKKCGRTTDKRQQLHQEAKENS